MSTNKINYDKFLGIYREIAESAGIDTAILIHKNFKGQQIVFPKKLYKTSAIIEEIKEKYDGKNIGKLAAEYNYTERYIRRLLNESSLDKNAKERSKEDKC